MRYYKHIAVFLKMEPMFRISYNMLLIGFFFTLIILKGGNRL